MLVSRFVPLTGMQGLIWNNNGKIELYMLELCMARSGESKPTRRAYVRVKVTIRCKYCGEKFILRGKREKNRIETGFKQCICDNREAFLIEEEPI